jgi:hypothetical protein
MQRGSIGQIELIQQLRSHTGLRQACVVIAGKEHYGGTPLQLFTQREPKLEVLCEIFGGAPCGVVARRINRQVERVPKQEHV